MNNSQLLLTLFGMAAAIFVCRVLPLFLPQRWLQLGYLQSLNRTLPLCIMLILLLSSLKIPHLSAPSFQALYIELSALTIVLLSYIWLRNTLLSVALGVAGINLLYFLI